MGHVRQLPDWFRGSISGTAELGGPSGNGDMGSGVLWDVTPTDTLPYLKNLRKKLFICSPESHFHCWLSGDIELI
jgi:hypothetical protein